MKKNIAKNSTVRFGQKRYKNTKRTEILKMAVKRAVHDFKETYNRLAWE